MATLLDRLLPKPDDRVLEIGTGGDYDAVLLLCHRLGDRQVTSIDLGPELVDPARTRLAAAGMHPALHVGDGLTPPGEPGSIDRIVATCAVSRIPTAWSKLLATGGRIVAPTIYAGALAVLDRTGPTTGATTKERRTSTAGCSTSSPRSTSPGWNSTTSPRRGGVPPPQVAEWAGHSVEVLLKVYAKCLDGQDMVARRRVMDALGRNSGA